MLATVLLLPGCAVGPDFKAPSLPAGAEGPLTSFQNDIESPDDSPNRWWELYSDERLNGFIQEALTANRELKAADANFAAARAAVAGVKSARYPSTHAVVGGIYGRDATTDEILEIGGHPPENTWLFEDILEVGYEVDLFGRVRRSIEAANANAESVAAARDALKVVTVAATARSFAQVCALGEQLKVAQHSLDVVSHEAEITVHRQEAGAAADFDVARAQALAAQVRAAIPILEGQRRATLLELTAVLGRAPANAPQELDGCIEPPHLSVLIPVGDGRALLKRRPDVRQAERRLAVSTAQIGIATADLYPTIRINGLVGSVGAELSDLTKNAGLTWGVGPALSWNFPNQLGPRARVRQAKASQVASLAAFDAVVLNALKETEQALTLYRSALDNHQALVDARDKIHKAFEMAHQQYLAGSVSNLELLTTEQTLVAVDAQLAASDGALVADQIAVFKALGGGWQDSRLTAGRIESR
jgi:NodT family efflux transporter outer membrane factor (OMF) lipoprotein